MLMSLLVSEQCVYLKGNATNCTNECVFTGLLECQCICKESHIKTFEAPEKAACKLFKITEALNGHGFITMFPLFSLEIS